MIKAYFILLILLLSCSLQNFSSAQQEGKKLNQFFEKQFETAISRYPTWQTYIGRKTNYGKLDNETIAYAKQDLELDKEALRKLKTFNYQILSSKDQLSYEIFEYQLKNSIENERWRFYTYPLNQMFGFQSETPAFLINMHRIESKSDALAYISRLKEIHRVFKERLVYLKEQEKRKILPPKFVFSKVLEDSKNIINGKPFDQSKKDSPLYQDFIKKVSMLDLNSKERDKLVLLAKDALLKYVKPAYKDLINYTQKLSKKVKGNFGVWALPNGKTFYNETLKDITTTDLSADEIHQIGLNEVKRIHAEMKAIMKNVKFKGSLKAFFKFMKSDQFLYPQTPDGRQAYLDQTNEFIINMDRALPKMFKTFPKAKLNVKPVEPFREKSAGIAFYSAPSLEGNRPGIYYVNLYKMNDNPKYKMEALTYHEAIPGHHMQVAIQNELSGLPTFRRTSHFTAYIEGWGLYAELLPKEFGFYADPYSDFGRLSMELWRATRLVVDTGIHAKRWSRNKAIKYLKDNTPNSELEIIKGVERYFVMPGQAVAYKVGMLKILELRKFAKAKLKDKFDIREFHDVILKNGAVPLFILEKNVIKWLKNH